MRLANTPVPLTRLARPTRLKSGGRGDLVVNSTFDFADFAKKPYGNFAASDPFHLYGLV